jgi:hypothetical protein
MAGFNTKEASLTPVGIRKSESMQGLPEALYDDSTRVEHLFVIEAGPTFR